VAVALRLWARADVAQAGDAAVIAREQLALFQAPRATVIDVREWRHCRDCGVDTVDEFYIITNAVWPLEEKGGMLCIGCLEARIGRNLAREDFTDSLLNTDPRLARSRRLEDRLGRERAHVQEVAAG
jgi:hypothetical protein